MREIIEALADNACAISFLVFVTAMAVAMIRGEGPWVVIGRKPEEEE